MHVALKEIENGVPSGLLLTHGTHVQGKRRARNLLTKRYPVTGEDGGFHLVNQLPTHEDVDVFSGDPVVVVCVERLSRPRLTRTLQPRLQPTWRPNRALDDRVQRRNGGSVKGLEKNTEEAGEDRR